MRIADNINYDTSSDACKVPPMLELGKQLASERSLASNKFGSEANNDCATEIEDMKDESTDKYYPLGSLYLKQKLCI